jgi:hypothetical protein
MTHLDEIVAYICDHYVAREARPTICNLLHKHWHELLPHQKDKILVQIVHFDDVDMFRFLVSIGMSLLWEDYESREPVDLAVVADAPRILSWCKGRHSYQEMVSSSRRVIEAIHHGDPHRLARLLDLGASMLESSGKYGSAVEMCLRELNGTKFKCRLFRVLYDHDPDTVVTVLRNLNITQDKIQAYVQAALRDPALH